MKRIGRGGHKTKVGVEAPGVVVLGVDREGADTANLGGLECAAHGVFEQARADPTTLPQPTRRYPRPRRRESNRTLPLEPDTDR
jgi:hypothetical protein